MLYPLSYEGAPRSYGGPPTERVRPHLPLPAVTQQLLGGCPGVRRDVRMGELAGGTDTQPVRRGGRRVIRVLSGAS